MYNKGDVVEGKGYFRCYLCLLCGKEESLHKKSTRSCPDSLRKTFPIYSATKTYHPNPEKPVFVKFKI